MAGKGFDAKAFLVNHTEKLAFGAFSLLSLALIGSSQWSTYKGTPAEIVNSVEEAKDKLTSHGWPEEEVQEV